MSMKNMFKGFYTGNIKENNDFYKDTETIFVFDTNVILDLYRNNPDTISAIKKAIEKVSDRVFLPYFTALEYQRRRLGVIDDQKHLISSTTSPIVEIINHAKQKLDKCTNTKARHYEGLNNQVIDLIKKSIELLNTDLESMYESLHESIEELNTKDIHREWIDTIFSGKIGTKKEQTHIDQLNIECKKRYESKIPPGFCDIDKNGQNDSSFKYDDINYQRAYGDFYIWKEILEYATSSNAKNVFFITNDAKDDFIFKVGREKENKENKGVHAILREEIINTAKVNHFDVLNTKELILNINNAYDLKIDTDNLNISTGNSYSARDKSNNAEYKLLLIRKLNQLKIELAELSKKLSVATDSEQNARIRLLMKGKLISIAKVNKLLSSFKE